MEATMGGDYSRLPFDRRRNYSGVLLQQGRILLDQDWNEQSAIVSRRFRAAVVDVLGRVFCELELQSKCAGQFLTPYELCRLAAKASVLGGIETISDRGYLRLVEPACGSGALIIAFAQELEAAGIQYEDALQVTAVDIDPRCTHMTYVQLALLGISGVIVHGNTLSLQEISVWVTPARIMNGRDWRLRRTELTESTSTIRSTWPT
jgi:methylase of polypeptide subunit release factors